MIKAILFDLWNTLANTTGEWKTAFDEAGYYKNRKNDEIFEKSINMRCYVDERELAEQMCSLWGGLDIDKVEKLLKKLRLKAGKKDILTDEQIKDKAEAIASMWSDETPKDVTIQPIQ